MKVDQFAVLAQSLKTMGEACGDQQGAGIVLRKDFAMPFEIGRRSGAQIDGDVEDDALEAGHEFGLIMRSALEMHTADDTFFPRHRVIDLCDAAGTKPGYFFDAEKAGKEAAVIAETLAFDKREVGQCCGGALKASHMMPLRMNLP